MCKLAKRYDSIDLRREDSDELETYYDEKGELLNNVLYLYDLFHEREALHDLAMRAVERDDGTAAELWEEFEQVDSEFWAYDEQLGDVPLWVFDELRDDGLII